jgi:hypothetical protein
MIAYMITYDFSSFAKFYFFFLNVINVISFTHEYYSGTHYNIKFENMSFLHLCMI